MFRINRNQGSHNSLCGGFIAILILGGVGGIFGYLSYRDIKVGRETFDWTPTDAVVISSFIDVSTDSEGDDSYAAIVTYTYTVNNIEYTASNYRYTTLMEYGSLSKAEEIVNSHQEGDEITVYYDPEDPTRVCILQGYQVYKVVILVVIGLIMGSVIIGTIVRFLRFSAILATDKGPQVNPYDYGKRNEEIGEKPPPVSNFQYGQPNPGYEDNSQNPDIRT